MKPARRLSCCNCTRRGHDATTCTNYRWSGHFLQSCFVRDYTKGPTYTADSPLPSLQKLPDLREPLNMERLGINVNSPSTYLFHFVNLNSSSSDPSSWKECSLIPNHIPAVDYPAPYQTQVHPTFLKTHFNCSCVPMEVFVKRSYELQGLPVITMRTPDERTLDQLKIIVNQWLVRPRDDKQLMSEIQPLPQTRQQLLQSLRMHFTKFWKRRVTHRFRKQFSSYCDLQRIIAMTRSRRTSEKNSKVQGVIANLTGIKYAFVAATYKYLVFDTSLDVLKRFYDFFKKVEELPDCVVPAEIYLSAVWYYFELFTPHLSPIILGSIMSWTKDPDYHVRGQRAYKQWIREVSNSIRGDGPEVTSEEINEPELSSGVDGHSSEEEAQSEQVNQRRNSKQVNQRRNSEQVNQKMNSEQEDGEVVDLEKSPDSGKAGLTAAEAFAIKKARKKAAYMKNLIARNVNLGLSEDVPLPRDPREFTREFLMEYTHKALEVAKEKNLIDIKMRVTEILQKDGFAPREPLIGLWVDIRQELAKRQKLMTKKRPTFTATKKRFKKKRKKNKDTYLP